MKGEVEGGALKPHGLLFSSELDEGQLMVLKPSDGPVLLPYLENSNLFI